MPSEDGARQVARFVPSIAALERRQWQACFSGEIEGYGYHLGAEEAGIAGFEFGWYVIEDDGRLLCAAPVFETRYDLATTAQGLVRKVLTAVRPWIPGHLSLGLSCLGSPVTETCQLGFAPNLDEAGRNAALATLLKFWQQHAASRGFALHGLKDLPGSANARFEPVLKKFGFCSVPSMPSANLAIDFPDVDAYLARLSPGTRKDMRRKLKARPIVRVEDRRNVDAVLPEIIEMYQETRARSDWAFEDLGAAYFSSILVHAPESAFFKLYWVGEKLVAANLLLSDGSELLDKFFVMRGEEGRNLNLYFLSWFENISHCLANGLTLYRSGQAGYETKLRLGSVLAPSWMYFRHSNRVVDALLKWVSPLLAVEQPAPTAKSVPVR